MMNLSQFRNHFQNQHVIEVRTDKKIVSERQIDTSSGKSVNLYQYNGCFYDVPESFEFPKPKFCDAMRF